MGRFDNRKKKKKIHLKKTENDRQTPASKILGKGKKRKFNITN